MSSEDIDKGARWSSDIAGELQDSRFGILCVTPENREAPWLMFEAGALSKSIETGHVSPFLVGVKRAEVTGPILQFQSTLFEHDDVLKLMRTINGACGESGIDDLRLEQAFEVWWPGLEGSLKAIAATLNPRPAAPQVVPSRSAADILEELLDLSRSSVRLLSSPMELLPPDYLRSLMSDRMRLEARQRRGFMEDPEGILRDAVVGYNRAFEATLESDHPSTLDLYERLQTAEMPLAHAASQLGLAWHVDSVRRLIGKRLLMSSEQRPRNTAVPAQAVPGRPVPAKAAPGRPAPAPAPGRPVPAKKFSSRPVPPKS